MYHFCNISYSQYFHNPLFADIYEKEVDDLIHQMVYGCNLPESSRHEDNERLKSKHTNKIDAKTAAKIAARDAKARKAKNKCMSSVIYS